MAGDPGLTAKKAGESYVVMFAILGVSVLFVLFASAVSAIFKIKEHALIHGASRNVFHISGSSLYGMNLRTINANDGSGDVVQGGPNFYS